MKSKNTLIIAALTALLLSAPAFNSFAQDNQVSAENTKSVSEKLNIMQIKPMQFRVSYSNPTTKSISVRIMDTEKNVLFSENRRVDANYLKYFDLSTLVDGTYTFEVTDGKDRATQSFDILTTTSRVVSSIN